MKKRRFIAITAVIIITIGAVSVYKWPALKGLAGEQTGESPDSGTTSRIMDTYNDLVNNGFGYESAGAWGDWGAVWNRIRSASGSSVNYESQSLAEYDDYKYTDGYGAGEIADEESTWSNTAANVWRDDRTGLYWSASQGQFTNLFNANHSLCPFFAEDPRGSSYDGLDADCGNAINTCATLSLESKTGEGADTDWYLPSQKELQQAYLDGIYNKAGHPFTTTSHFWSATERSDSTSYAWRVNLHNGYTGNNGKSNSYDVRCVRRD